MALFTSPTTMNWYHVGYFAGVLAILWSLPFMPRWIQDLRRRWLLSRYPLVNPKWDAEARRNFSSESQMVLIKKGLTLNNGGPFRMNALTGQCLCIPHKYSEEYKNIPELDLPSTTKFDFPIAYPGFEGVRTSVGNTALVVRDAVKNELGGMLPTAITLLARQAPAAVTKVFGDNVGEWKTIDDLAAAVLKCIGQFTARVFLGDDFANEPEWQRISVDYSVFLYRASFAMKQWPAVLYPLVNLFLPECLTLRREVETASKLLRPAVKRRLSEAGQRHMGEKIQGDGYPSGPLNSVDWFFDAAINYKEQPSRFDYLSGEFTLAMLSNRTTSMLGGVALSLLVSHLEYVQPLREEIIQVLSETKRFDKNSMYKLKLMDSFLKESGRLQSFPTQSRRIALKDITLSDGNFIPKGTYCVIAPTPMMDPQYYGPDPTHFDGYRFLKLRQQADAAGDIDGDGKFQFVSTSAEEITFSSGIWACPGRFFASYMLKVLFSYLLLHYDFSQAADTVAKDGSHVVGSAYSRSMYGQGVMYKSRRSEIDWITLCA